MPVPETDVSDGALVSVDKGGVDNHDAVGEMGGGKLLGDDKAVTHSDDSEGEVSGVALLGVESDGVDDHEAAVKCGDRAIDCCMGGGRYDSIREKGRAQEDLISPCQMSVDKSTDTGVRLVRHGGGLVGQGED